MWCSRPYSADSLDISEQPRARRVKFQGEQQEQQQQGERGRVVFAELNPAALVLEQKLTNSKTLTQGSKINLQSQYVFFPWLHSDVCCVYVTTYVCWDVR